MGKKIELEIPTYPGPNSPNTSQDAKKTEDLLVDIPPPGDSAGTTKKPGFFGSLFGKLKKKEEPVKETMPVEPKEELPKKSKEEPPKKQRQEPIKKAKEPVIEKPFEDKQGFFSRFRHKEPAKEEPVVKPWKVGGSKKSPSPKTTVDPEAFTKDISKINQEIDRINKELSKLK